jgi:hypothetical protein
MSSDARLLDGGEERGVEIISMDERGCRLGVDVISIEDRLLEGGEGVGVPINAMMQSQQAQEGWCEIASIGVILVERVGCLRWFVLIELFSTTAGLS